MITDPQSIRFANEVIRPLSEEVRALVAKIGAAQTTWYAGMNAKFPNNSTALDDGRENEGVSRLTGADVNSVMGILIAMSQASNSEIISKPCVRSLSAS